jgi:hypothetical protein
MISTGTGETLVAHGIWVEDSAPEILMVPVEFSGMLFDSDKSEGSECGRRWPGMTYEIGGKQYSGLDVRKMHVK